MRAVELPWPDQPFDVAVTERPDGLVNLTVDVGHQVQRETDTLWLVPPEFKSISRLVPGGNVSLLHNRLASVLAGAGALIAGLLVASPAQALPSALQIAGQVDRPVTVEGGAFFDASFVAAERSAARIDTFLAGTNDASGTLFIDDKIRVDVLHADGTTAIAEHDFSSGCTTQEPVDNLDLSAVLAPGRNVIRIRLEDTCGGNEGHSAIWLVGNGTYSSFVGDRQYVAMGDSFASGEGAEDNQFLAGTVGPTGIRNETTGCHRSTTSWGQLVNNALIDKGRIDPEDFAFVACSGATISDIYGANITYKSKIGENEAPQIDAISGSTILTTLSIGGNDASFADIMAACADYVLHPGLGCKRSGSTASKAADAGKKSCGTASMSAGWARTSTEPSRRSTSTSPAR